MAFFGGFGRGKRYFAARILRTGRGDAVAATWIFRGGESRRRRGCDVDIPSRRAAAAPWLRRGYSVEASRGAAAAMWKFDRDRRMHQVRRQPVAIAGAAAPEHHVRRERRPRPAPFKAARVDANGTLRLGWRSENTAFYGDAPNATANEKGELQYLTYDPTHGVAVEATARVAGDGVVGFALCGSDAATRADANPRGQTFFFLETAEREDFFSSRPRSATGRGTTGTGYAGYTGQTGYTGHNGYTRYTG